MDKTFHLRGTEARITELLGELTDALEILYSCRRLDVPVNDNFLGYIDQLIEQIESSRGCSIASSENLAYWPTSLLAEA